MAPIRLGRIDLKPAAPVLPAAWRERGVALRPRRPRDLDFLRRLFRSTRWDEAMAAGLDEAAATAFLDSQFALQCRHFDLHYARGGRRMIIVADGEPVGRCDLWRGAAAFPPELRLVDISLLPQWRGRGLGSALLGALQALAEGEGAVLVLHVDKLNPAARLYDRLGFRPAADTGMAWRMEWRAPQRAPN